MGKRDIFDVLNDAAIDQHEELVEIAARHEPNPVSARVSATISFLTIGVRGYQALGRIGLLEATKESMMRQLSEIWDAAEREDREEN